QVDAPDDQVWSQGTGGVQDQAEVGDAFGTSLAAGHFDGDAFSDLAIGVPLEDSDTTADVGAVAVLYGSAGGLQASSPDDQLWSQESPNVLDHPEVSDEFGWSVG